jgi:hypothetical protein
MGIDTGQDADRTARLRIAFETLCLIIWSDLMRVDDLVFAFVTVSSILIEAGEDAVDDAPPPCAPSKCDRRTRRGS